MANSCGKRGRALQADGRFAVAMVATVALLGCAAVLGIVIGSPSVGLPDVLALAFGAPAEQTAANVIWNIRLPRVLAALLAGAALAQAGALIQAALDNPLASPNVIGVNAGSGFFVLLAACAFPNAFGFAPVAAFLGALCVAGLIFAVAGLGGSSRLTVVLAGMAFTAIFTAGMNTILIVNPDAYVGASGFLIGGLSGVKLSEVIVPAARSAWCWCSACCRARGSTCSRWASIRRTPWASTSAARALPHWCPPPRSRVAR